MKKALKDFAKSIDDSTTLSDLEMLEMDIELPYPSPPRHTRLKEPMNLEKGRLDIRDICHCAGVNLYGITRCSFK